MKKTVRNLFALVLVVVMVALLFTACSSATTNQNATSDESASQAPAASVAATAASDTGSDTTAAGTVIKPKNGTQYKIGYSNYVLVYNSWITLEATLAQLCQDKGWDYIKTDANGDINKQISDLEDLDAQQCDFIFVNTTDPAMMTPTINKVVERGTPVVSLDNILGSDTNLLTTITANNRQNGFLVGQWAADKVQGDIKAVIVSGVKGESLCELRREGCLEGITERRLQTQGNCNIQIVAQLYTDWYADQSISQMEDVIARNVDFNLIISEADVMALPIYNLLEQKGMADKVVFAATADAQKEALELIQTTDNYATGLNSFVQQAQLAEQTAEAYFNGQTDFSEITYTESACITKDNVAKYYDPNASF